MIKGLLQYVAFGIARPPGTMWSIERAFFTYKKRYRGQPESYYAYHALSSRYPGKKGIKEIADQFVDLDSAILEAVRLDFGSEAKEKIKQLLNSFPLCSSCGIF